MLCPSPGTNRDGPLAAGIGGQRRRAKLLKGARVMGTRKTTTPAYCDQRADGRGINHNPPAAAGVASTQPKSVFRRGAGAGTGNPLRKTVRPVV